MACSAASLDRVVVVAFVNKTSSHICIRRSFWSWLGFLIRHYRLLCWLLIEFCQERLECFVLRFSVEKEVDEDVARDDGFRIFLRFEVADHLECWNEVSARRLVKLIDALRIVVFQLVVPVGHLAVVVKSRVVFFFFFFGPSFVVRNYEFTQLLLFLWRKLHQLRIKVLLVVEVHPPLALKMLLREVSFNGLSRLADVPVDRLFRRVLASDCGCHCLLNLN